MTNERILNLAWHEAVNIWIREKARLAENPDNKITQFREEKAWNEVKEIEAMMKAEAEEPKEDKSER